MSDRLMLLDTASLYFRAFFGVPDTVRAPDGTPVNAVRGLLDMIARLVTDFAPTHVVACWDDDWRPQWRVDLIPSYKSHRVVEVVPVGPDVEEVPDPLVVQVPVIREALGVLGIPIVGAAEHEADDVIGTLATDARMPVDVVTGDRDLFQLADDERDVRIIYTARGMSKLELVTDAVVVTKYGVHASQYADFATMRGDASDGLPGVPGVGEKTAAGLLQDFGSLEAIVAAANGGPSATVPGVGLSSDTAAPRMSAGVRAKIAAAADYLAVAPTVVAVARGLDLRFELETARLEPLDATGRDAAAALADRWNLGGSMTRALGVLPEHE